MHHHFPPRSSDLISPKSIGPMTDIDMSDNISGKSHEGDERLHPKEGMEGGIDLGFEELGFTSMVDVGGQLQKKLNAHHLSMLAIGGSVGTGLIIGTGSALARGGPAAILIAYSLIGFVVYCVLGALGEIAAWVPLSSGFAGYAARYIDSAMGFALGYCYWCKYLVLPPTQFTAKPSEDI
ncbi:amino acid permease-domain-containing protein [Exophiala viscosa]|uniref:amino acid permease-domain-containing protein n=1 Tax=Exophiala viscosa TaxID=2486360 RepID=UPI0021932887|nr:amino acid permease-domain-containing protein [Exophiala viscosa]